MIFRRSMFPYKWTKRHSCYRTEYVAVRWDRVLTEKSGDIIWVPYSKCNVQETLNGCYGQVISPNLAFEIRLWQGKLVVSTAWRHLSEFLLAVVVYPWRGLWITRRIYSIKRRLEWALHSNSQQIVGLDSLFRLPRNLHLDAVPKLPQSSRSSCDLLCSNILLCSTNESSQLVGISRLERSQASPRRHGFNVGCVLSAGEHINCPCADFLSFVFWYFLKFHNHLCISKCDELFRMCIAIGCLAWKSAF